MLDLSRTPYLSDQLDKYVRDLVKTVDRVLKKYDKLPPNVTRAILTQIWSATKYLIGSTSKEIPYEIVYALDLARAEWKKKECLITTALVDDQQYHYNMLSSSATKLISYFLGKPPSYELIQIALPRLYKHKPLYIVALYHELGHFLANDLKITSSSLIFYPPKGPDPVEERYHREEFFADLLAACYTGRSLIFFLSAYFPDDPDCDTHPSTKRRIENIESFLDNKTNSTIDMFHDVLHKLKLPELKKRYAKPEISKTFDNIRPYDLANEEELHGILEAGWEYLQKIFATPPGRWVKMNEFERDRQVNDLIEKSIRNKLIKTKWEDEAS